MRKIILILAVAMVATSASGAAATGGVHTATRPYTVERGAVVNDGASTWVGTQPETFVAGPRDHRVTIALADDSGQAVAGRVEIGDQAVEFCSQTDQPLPVHKGDEINVSATFGPCGSAVSTVTQGTITATFTR